MDLNEILTVLRQSFVANSTVSLFILTLPIPIVNLMAQAAANSRY